MRYRSSFTLRLAACALALAGCSAKPAAKAAARSDSTKSSGGEVAASSTPSGAATAATPASIEDAWRKFTHGDTSKMDLNPGRKPMDLSSYRSAIRAGAKRMDAWPKGPEHLAGALFPENRIVAYYGNPHSKKMGVLGEYPEQQMLSMLDKTIADWRKADPSTPVIPAIHLVSVVAQGDPGPDGGYRRRENSQTIEQAYNWAKSRKGLLFLDIQAGHSTVQTELPLLLKYLERPEVMLGVDPEFYMHYKREGLKPSTKVGQMMASDVNYAIQTLDKLVREKNLPPKILIVHRFRADMVPDAENIKPTPHVQVVMDMDGWGPPWLKFDSYRDYIVTHPVEYTGFKLFYHNDTRKGDALLTPFEVLRLLPKPLYIQYQ